jgi:hypothetical protein
MNISNVSSTTNTYPAPAPASGKPVQRGDHDGDADDQAGAVSGSAASEAAESGRLNATA